MHYTGFALGVLASAGLLAAQPSLTGTRELTTGADLSAEMTAGIGRYLDRELAGSIAGRPAHWNPDFSSRATYEKSVAPNRGRLTRIIGAVDGRVTGGDVEYIASVSVPAKVAETTEFIAYAVRWPVFELVYGEGLLLQPKTAVKSRIVAIPDGDQTPEMLVGLAPGLPIERQYARRLAEHGCQVLIPTIIDRSETRSGNAAIKQYTNQPHREWIYRQAYTFGRHIIGYEVQKVLAAVDWFARPNASGRAPIGVLGWGEGGLLAFYSAALDTRIDAVLVSGYFEKREKVWAEPIYRNISGLLREFGDAEIARLVVPRKLVIEHASAPEIAGPPAHRPGQSRKAGSAAPGRIAPPEFAAVRSEFERARQLAGPFHSSIRLLHEKGRTKGPMNEQSVLAFLRELQPATPGLSPPQPAPADARTGFDPTDRLHRQVAELERHTQRFIEASRTVRSDFLWNKAPPTTPDKWRAAMRPYQQHLWETVYGKLPVSDLPLNAQARQIYDRSTWTGYEVTIDVLPDIFAWGYLLLPKDIRPGERRPVVVTQHGGSGVPSVVMSEEGMRAYKAFAVQLVERGFIVFAPHFPWKNGHDYRVLGRKLNPLGLSVFSVILAQHERILDWLVTQPWVDADRIGLYGLSWGGKVAVNVPALLNRYSLTICSGNFNEWIWKSATTGWSNSYMFAQEYEMFYFNLGMTFSHAELAALIAPRPFMVERGHSDGVSTDEWVAFEYAKVNRLYNKLGIPERTRIEYFIGGHVIHGVGAFEFLQQHFKWPAGPVADTPIRPLTQSEKL